MNCSSKAAVKHAFFYESAELTTADASPSPPVVPRLSSETVWAIKSVKRGEVHITFVRNQDFLERYIQPSPSLRPRRKRRSSVYEMRKLGEVINQGKWTDTNRIHTYPETTIYMRALEKIKTRLWTWRLIALNQFPMGIDPLRNTAQARDLRTPPHSSPSHTFLDNANNPEFFFLYSGVRILSQP